jgi:hypothetical protein
MELDGVFTKYTSVSSFHNPFTFFSADADRDSVYTPPAYQTMAAISAWSLSVWEVGVGGNEECTP